VEGYHTMPEKSPAARPGTDNAISQPKPLDRFIMALDGLAELARTEVSGKEIAAQVAERMLTADTFEEALAAQDAGLASGRDLVGREILITDFDVFKSDPKYAEHTLGYYYRVEAVSIETGEELVFATGATNILTLLYVARIKGKLPWECVITSKDTENGALLTLKPLTKRAVQV
jgi:hypothetical protein